VIRKVTFPGVNMDVGHARNLTWAKDNDPSKWIGYNRLRGQYMSALEHAMAERFFNSPSRCYTQGDPSGNASLPACPQGISAMKAIALAAQGGQKVYTITREVYQNNPDIVSSGLWAHSQDTKDRIQRALDMGYEVTLHEAPIAQDGWIGAGFTLIDPATGAGGYLIEGGLNGGFLGLEVDLTFGISFGAISGVSAEQWGEFFLNTLANVYGALKDKLKLILGNFLGVLMNLLDSWDIYTGCLGGEGAIRALAFLFMATALGLLVTAGLAGANIIVIILVMSFLAVLISTMKDAFLKCK
jgi:hypothetical protein